MTIEELKSLVEKAEFQPNRSDNQNDRALKNLQYILSDLAPEILAVVDTANRIRGHQGPYIDTDGDPDGFMLLDALDAFNAKLESL